MPWKPNRIHFVDRLGEGGFGEVYLVDLYQPSDFVQRLAMKWLKVEVKHLHNVSARLRDEARLLALLNHDNIVKVVDFHHINDRPAIFMEYVDGVSISELRKKVKVPPTIASEIISIAAQALSAAYKTKNPITGKPLQVIHRDVKPSNILLSKYGTVKLLDFGIAKADFLREAQTKSFRMGTPRYMAPERWFNETLTDKVDVYALGVCFYELLTGQAFHRPPLSTNGFNKHMSNAMDKLLYRQLPREIQVPLTKLIRTTLNYYPQNRPSAANLSAQLNRLFAPYRTEALRHYSSRIVPSLRRVQPQRKPQYILPGDIVTAEMQCTDLLPKPPPVQQTISPKIALPRRRPFLENQKRLPLMLAACLFVITIMHPKFEWKQWINSQQTADKRGFHKPDASSHQSPKTKFSKKPSSHSFHRKSRSRIVINLTSKPKGAKVYIDGKEVGKTPIHQYKISTGKHSIIMQRNRRKITRPIIITSKQKAFSWNIKKSTWTSLSRKN